jgi:hypothetical protein
MPANHVSPIAAQMTFGVEIECHLPLALPIQIGGYCHGIQVPELPAGWKAERDGSIECGPERKRCEIVSPILKGQDGLRQLRFVLTWLHEHGARVNWSCGFHVHVGFGAGLVSEIGRVVATVARYERALYAVTGTHTREHRPDGKNFCKPINGDHNYTSRWKDKTRSVASYSDFPWDRYFSLNLTNLQGGTKPTVEFRVFAGTLSVVKASAYVQVCLGIVERALTINRTPAWNLEKNRAEQERTAGMGAGRFATVKLIYGLGWRKGESDRPFGLIDPADDLPAVGTMVAELYRLADKYDSPDAPIEAEVA